MFLKMDKNGMSLHFCNRVQFVKIKTCVVTFAVYSDNYLACLHSECVTHTQFMFTTESVCVMCSTVGRPRRDDVRIFSEIVAISVLYIYLRLFWLLPYMHKLTDILVKSMQCNVYTSCEMCVLLCVTMIKMCRYCRWHAMLLYTSIIYTRRTFPSQ